MIRSLRQRSRDTTWPNLALYISALVKLNTNGAIGPGSHWPRSCPLVAKTGRS